MKQTSFCSVDRAIVNKRKSRLTCARCLTTSTGTRVRHAH
jgi:hypothetical protein